MGKQPLEHGILQPLRVCELIINNLLYRALRHQHFARLTGLSAWSDLVYSRLKDILPSFKPPNQINTRGSQSTCNGLLLDDLFGQSIVCGNIKTLHDLTSVTLPCSMHSKPAYSCEPAGFRNPFRSDHPSLSWPITVRLWSDIHHKASTCPRWVDWWQCAVVPTT
jgi:hypothetical protein